MKLSSLKAIALVCFCAAICGCGKAKRTTLRVYAGAGLRRAMDVMAEKFEKESGVRCEIDYGGSGMIISRAKEDRDADLFIPGDVWYVDRLNELTGNIKSKTTISYFVPTIIVQKGNPKNIKSVKNFLRKDVQVALGNPKACQVGRLTVKILANAGIRYEDVSAKSSLTVNELAVWVKMRDVDAAIVWDAIAANVADSVDMIEIPKQVNKVSTVVVGLLKTSTHKGEAKAFVEFMAGPEGRKILLGKGYRVDPPYGAK